MIAHVRAALTTLLVVTVVAGCGGGGFELTVGDCVRTPGEPDPASGMAEVEIVDCDEPHELEVVHVATLPSDAVQGEALVDAVTEACLGDAFTDYVGQPADVSDLELLPIPPTAEDLERGDREVVCTVRPPGGGTSEGSVRGGRA